MSKLTCLICQEDVRVPVELTCFRCPKQNNGSNPNIGPSCNDFIRVCMMCARDYLELNKVPRERKGSCKCLICNTRVNPQNLSGAGSCYKKDYCYMRLDSRTNYPCFHSEKGCEFTGTQQQLDNHIQYDCQYRMTSCPCGTLYRVCDKEKHRASCHHYRLCPDCETYVLNIDFRNHLRDNHSKEICPHEGCGKIISRDSFNVHKDKCLHRIVKCPRCLGPVPAVVYSTHIGNHIRACQQNISGFMEEIDKATAEMSKLIEILNGITLEE
jgi:hypothetical protein